MAATNFFLSLLVYVLASHMVDAKPDFLGNRGVHHRHHHHHPATLAASLKNTVTVVASDSIVPRPPSPTSRFTTSTVSRGPALSTATTLALECEADDTEEPTTSASEDPVTSEILTSSETALPTKLSKPSLTPNGNKAGIAGGDAYTFFQDHIGWWYDWCDYFSSGKTLFLDLTLEKPNHRTPHPSKSGKPIGVPMLWGAGTADPVDAARLAAFKQITSPPPYVLAYEEPDCPPGSGSAGMSVSSGVSGWERLIVPLGRKGSLMGSPSMCKQADETWLAQFGSQISTQWDFTAVHINKNNIAGVKKDIVSPTPLMHNRWALSVKQEHYWNTYKKPIWVTEFACVNGQSLTLPRFRVDFYAVS
ncbi:hypothetical protein C0991_004622 [Blastosporella zonata]|nr:hypothetical protein C0991_004622 [Blastosporella zonata]